MRIAGNIPNRTLLANLETAQTKTVDLQNQLSSNTRIAKPSDDPAGVETVIKLKTGLARVEQWKQNADKAVSFADAVDGVMGDITDEMQRVRELAVQGASETLTASDRQNIKAEIDQIAEAIRSNANMEVGDKPMFAGTKTNGVPLPIPGAAWGGNSGALTYEVGSGINIPVSVNGQTLFETPAVKTAAGQSAAGLFDTLSSLSQALANNDTQGINSSLQNIDANLNNIGVLRADLGARVNRLTAAQSQLAATQQALQTGLSSVQDTDMAQTIVQYQAQANVYQAALSTGAKISQLSLVDFMR